MKSHSITLCPFLAKSLNKMIINEMFITRKTYKPAYTGFESLYKLSIEISYFSVDYRQLEKSWTQSKATGFTKCRVFPFKFEVSYNVVFGVAYYIKGLFT